MERSINDALELEMFPLWSCNTEGYIFFKFLSKSRWLFMAHKSSIKQNLLLERHALHKSIFVVSNSHLFS